MKHMSASKTLLVLAWLCLTSTRCYSPDLSWEMLMLSRIAYCADLSKVADWTCKLCPELPGVTNITVIADSGVGMQLIVAARPSEVLVGFRGSEVLMNFIKDIEIGTSAPFPGGCPGCTVHDGFLSTWNAVRNRTIHAVQDLLAIDPSAALRVTGHSLGASVAQIACMDMYLHGVTCSSVYTFGAPRTGNSKFVLGFSEMIPDNWRVTHWKDPIPHLPPPEIGYIHTATEMFYDSESTSLRHCNGDGEDADCSAQFEVAVCLVCCVSDHLTYMNTSLGQSQCED